MSPHSLACSDFTLYIFKRWLLNCVNNIAIGLIMWKSCKKTLGHRMITGTVSLIDGENIVSSFCREKTWCRQMIVKSSIH